MTWGLLPARCFGSGLREGMSWFEMERSMRSNSLEGSFEAERPRCLVCAGTTERLFEKLVLGHHAVAYHRCTGCGFTQTDRPHWLDEAYDPPTSPLDIGAVIRPLNLSRLTSELLTHHFDARGRFLDYGGGVGLFVRLMRDRGFR